MNLLSTRGYSFPILVFVEERRHEDSVYVATNMDDLCKIFYHTLMSRFEFGLYEKPDSIEDYVYFTDEEKGILDIPTDSVPDALKSTRERLERQRERATRAYETELKFWSDLNRILAAPYTDALTMRDSNGSLLTAVLLSERIGNEYEGVRLESPAPIVEYEDED